MRVLRLAVTVLLVAQLTTRVAEAQASVDATFTGWHIYNKPENWTPAGVPNNSAERSYNVAVPAGKFLTVDLEATINNLALDRTLLTVAGHSLIVQGATAVTGALPTEEDFFPGNSTLVRISNGKLDAGALSSFRDGVLTGVWEIGGEPALSAAATLQFDGANVVALRKAQLRLAGALSRVTDENGNDGLRNLAHVESSSELHIARRDFTTAASLTNDGHLSISGGLFHIQGPLTNFSPTSRTLLSGSYEISQSVGPTAGILRFPGADIVTNAATIELSGKLSSITDGNGADALRNFSRNTNSGVFRLADRDFTTSGDFTNDGLLAGSGTFIVTGALTNYDPATRRLSGGRFHSHIQFRGADVVRNAASVGPGVMFDENWQNALRNLALNEETGTLSISGRQFRPAGEFVNAGRMLLSASLDASGSGLVMPEGVPYVQVAGETVLSGSAGIAGRVEIRGGLLTASGSFATGSPAISGDVLIGDGGTWVVDTLPVSGNVEFSSGSTFRVRVSEWARGLQANHGFVHLAGTLEIDFDDVMPPDSSAAIPIIRSHALTGAFSNAPHGARIPTSGGRGSFVVLYQFNNTVFLTGYERIPPAAQLLNISTRANVGTGNDAAIGGFIVGTNNKRVLVRALGPSLQGQGVSGVLQNPTLALHNSSGAVIASNDDWAATQRDEIIAAGLAPEDDRESAIVATLGRGTYTAMMRGQNDTTGVGLVEVYDVSHQAGGKIGNLSTRGRVAADEPLIGGFIAGGRGEGKAELFVRGVGPSLRHRGVQDSLPDTTLELRAANGELVAFNDDIERVVEGAERPPFYFAGADDKDAQIFATVPPGNYTAIVRGKNGASGVALVEFYDINR